MLIIVWILLIYSGRTLLWITFLNERHTCTHTQIMFRFHKMRCIISLNICCKSIYIFTWFVYIIQFVCYLCFHHAEHKQCVLPAYSVYNWTSIKDISLLNTLLFALSLSIMESTVERQDTSLPLSYCLPFLRSTPTFELSKRL